MMTCAKIRCIACGKEYEVDPAYNIYAPCPDCKSTLPKRTVWLEDIAPMTEADYDRLTNVKVPR